METDALERLRALRKQRKPVETPDDLPADWRCEWEERAAIREYDGGQAREHAEAEAFTEILARMRAAGVFDGYRT